MRTPNTECIICKKLLYRRKFELKRIRYSSCMEHRTIAQKMFGVTEKQLETLKLGRQKGTNHRNGYTHREESKRKCSDSHKILHINAPNKAKERGLKTREENHYNWKGGITKLNKSIRGMVENRKWMDEIKKRDCKCMDCSSIKNLEAHHVVSLSILIEKYGIKSREDARKYSNFLWDLNNGITLCQKCHYNKHGRTYNDIV